MMDNFLGRTAFAAIMLVVSPVGQGAPLLQSLAPVMSNFTFGAGADFTVPTGTGFGDVTAALSAVDLLIPSAGGSTSGCEASDFAGFPAGDIALIQRGACTFELKAENADAAGAVGVLLFNEGNGAGRLDAINISLGAFAGSLPVFFASFGVGEFLYNGVPNGSTNFVVRMKVTQEDLAAPVPEPATLALLCIALAGLGFSRRRNLH